MSYIISELMVPMWLPIRTWLFPAFKYGKKESTKAKLVCLRRLFFVDKIPCLMIKYLESSLFSLSSQRREVSTWGKISSASTSCGRLLPIRTAWNITLGITVKSVLKSTYTRINFLVYLTPFRMEMTLRGNWELLLYKGLGSKYSQGLFFLSSTKKRPVTLSGYSPNTDN